MSFAALEASHYGAVSRAARSGSGRIRRSPLGDKSPNASPVVDLTTNKPPFSIYQDGPKDIRRNSSSRTKTYRTSNSFHPLPPVLSASTLQLPSLPDFSFHQITLSASLAPHLIPSPNLSPSVSQPHLLPEEASLEKVYDIPTVQHPNSPYVPWALPVRLEILRPLTPQSELSFPSNRYSRPRSRTGARVPEPIGRNADLDQLNDKPAKGTHGWKNLRHVVKKNVHHVAKRIVKLKKPSKVNAGTTPQSMEVPNGSRNYGAVPSYARPARFRSSMTSVDSTDTTTLATWLAARQRQDKDFDPDRIMSLEDYELKGSWLNLPKGRSHLGGLCGVQESEGHSDRRRPAERRSYASLRRTTSLSPLDENATTDSFNHLPLRLDFAPISPIACSGSVSLDLLAKLEWERSMPGGWTFGA